jgi:NO-binding membrane sensor protein with MHYT domain
MGVGIWSMHYIGMLAFNLPVPVLYDWPTVLLSLMAAVFAAAVALGGSSTRRQSEEYGLATGWLAARLWVAESPSCTTPEWRQCGCLRCAQMPRCS